MEFPLNECCKRNGDATRSADSKKNCNICSFFHMHGLVFFLSVCLFVSGWVHIWQVICYFWCGTVCHSIPFNRWCLGGLLYLTTWSFSHKCQMIKCLHLKFIAFHFILLDFFLGCRHSSVDCQTFDRLWFSDRTNNLSFSPLTSQTSQFFCLPAYKLKTFHLWQAYTTSLFMSTNAIFTKSFYKSRETCRNSWDFSIFLWHSLSGVKYSANLNYFKWIRTYFVRLLILSALKYIVYKAFMSTFEC